MIPFLEILTGEAQGRRFTLAVGRTYRVGRVAPAEIQVLDDPMLSSLHFQIAWDGTTCLLTDLGTRFGTLVNGVAAQQSALKPGDTLVAGRTTFRMGLEGHAPLAAPAGMPPT